MEQSGTRHLVFSPWYGDAVRSLYSVLAGTEPVDVVNVYTALPPRRTYPGAWDVLTGATDARQRMRDRAAEDRLARAITDTPATDLAFFDRQYRRGRVDLRKLRRAVAPLVEGVSHIWVPAALGQADPDRIAVRELGATLSGDVEVRVYADLPYATQFGWPSWVTGEERHAFLDVDAAWRASLASSRLPIGDMQPILVPITGRQLPQKLAACQLYRSQLPAIERGPFQALTHPKVFGFEVYWAPLR